jgi:cardiolipin synthase
MKRIRYSKGEEETCLGAASLHGRDLGARFTVREVGGLTRGIQRIFQGRRKQSPKARTFVGCYRLSLGGETFQGAYYSPQLPTDGGVEVLYRIGRDNNAVELLIDGKNAFPAFYKAFDEARHHIHLETFIYKEDRIGWDVARRLSAKARQGVRVRVLVDRLGSLRTGRVRRSLERSGVQVILYGPIGEGLGNLVKGAFRSLVDGVKSFFGFGGKRKPREKRTIVNRDHRKLMVMDGRVAFLGGMGIAEDYMVWHDIQARVRGTVVHELQRHFFDRWQVSGGKVEADTAAYFPPLKNRVGTLPVRVVTTVPGLVEDCRREYESVIRGARRKIWIENPYFLDDAIIDGLKAAVRRKVDVLVICPDEGKTDVKMVSGALGFVSNEIVRSGVRLYAYQPTMVHAKVATVDGTWSTVGSCNLDNISLRRIAELNIVVMDRGFAAAMERDVFSVDLGRSKRVGLQKDPWYKKIRNGFFHLIRSWL